MAGNKKIYVLDCGGQYCHLIASRLRRHEALSVIVPCDGVLRTVEAGGRLALKPGESVTLMPGIWHAFWAEGKDCLIGEVSTVNDDKTDNVFREPIGRFSEIAEDVAPAHLLVSDY